MSLATWFQIQDDVDPAPLTRAEIVDFLSSNNFLFDDSVIDFFLLTGGLEGHIPGTLFHLWGIRNYYNNMSEWWGETKTSHIYVGDAMISSHLVSIGPVKSSFGFYFESNDYYKETDTIAAGISIIESEDTYPFI